jgi:prolyl-tRNA synthetase
MLADADLIGVPWRAVISEKTGDKIELASRANHEPKLYTIHQLLKML